MAAQGSLTDTDAYSEAFDPVASKYSEPPEGFTTEAVDEGDDEGTSVPAPTTTAPKQSEVAQSEAMRETQQENLQLKERIRHLEEELESAHRTASTIEELAARLDLEEKKREEAAAHGDPVARIAQLEDELLAKSHECVEHGEKNFKLADALEKKSAKLKDVQADVFEARASLVAEIAGGEADPRNFTHVTIVELCRLATKQYGPKKLGPAGSRTMGRTSRAPSTRPASAGGASAGGRSNRSARSGGGGGAGGDAELPQWSRDEGEGADGASGSGGRGEGGDEDSEEGAATGAILAERQIKSLRERNRKLQGNIEALENKLQQADALLRKKQHAENLSTKWADNVRREREGREVAEEEIARTQEKVEALSEHIEKLMTHLKHEAAAKAKAYEAQRRAEKEVQLLRNRNAALAKKNSVREKVVVELKEGCKILEDQLRLMDEKYIELRGKLDWTRAHSQKEVRKVQNQADRLRRQVLMAQSMGALPTRLDSPPDHAGADTSGHSGGGRSGASDKKTRTSTLMGMKSKNRGGVSAQVWATKKDEVRDVPGVHVPEGLGGEDDPSLPWSESKTSALRGSGRK